MKITHSQSVALFIGIVDCLFMIPLIPAAILFFLGFLYLGSFAVFMLFTREYIFGVVFFAFCFLLMSFAGFGLHLMIGYFKHYKGYLTAKEVDRLWIKTIIYNSILFFPAFYINLQCNFTERYMGGIYDRMFYDYTKLPLLLNFWWFIAIISAFSALASIKTPMFSNKLKP